jgi:hypothetical protein
MSRKSVQRFCNGGPRKIKDLARECENRIGMPVAGTNRPVPRSAALK